MGIRSEVITTKVAPEVKEAIQKLAADNNMKVSSFVSQLLEKVIQEANDKNE